MVWIAAVAGLVGTSTAASGQTAVDPGTGSAFAQGYKIDPRSGRLSFGITYGLSLSGHQNNVAVGEARSVDLGVIGSTLSAEGCDGGEPTFPKEDQPQPLVVRSTDENKSRSETENAVSKSAQATDQPFAEAIAVTAASGDPAAIQIGSTTSRTRSGIIDGKRVATAVTEVSDITFAAGAVVLKGLRWEASFQTAPSEAASGSFTIDGIMSAGQSIPVGDLASGLTEANSVLEPLGFAITAPRVRNESGIVFVDPLRISIVPAEERDGILGPVFNALAPVRKSVFDALIEADCSNGSLITIADIVLGSVTGAGSLNIELGGVTATSADLGQTSFLGGIPDLSLSGASPGVPATQGTLGTSGSSGGGGSFSPGGTTSGGSTDVSTTPTTAGSVATTPVASNDDEVALPAPKLTGSRGGPLVGVGLGGLLLLAALAEGDRRKMRRAQRSAPMEVMA